MKKNIGFYQRTARAVLGVLFLWVGTYGIVNPIGRVFILVLGVWFLAEAAIGFCPLFYMLGVKSSEDKLSKDNLLLIGMIGIQAVAAFEWWRAAFGKLTNDFGKNFPVSLQFYTSEKNPFPNFAQFLQDQIAPRAEIFVQLVQWGQVAVAIGLLVGAGLIILPKIKFKQYGYFLSIVALFFGIVMNALFWLAAGWTNAGVAELNVVMFWVQLMLIYVWAAFFLRTEQGGVDEGISGHFIYEEQEIYEISE